MIMQGTTPRSLSWAGCLGVLALGLLLPVLPVQGQSAAPARETATKDTRDDQIETLKRAIKILEDQKRGDTKGAEATKIDPADLKKAQAELAELSRAVKVKQDELQVLQEKLQKAAIRLKTMSGAPMGVFEWKSDEKPEAAANAIKYRIEAQTRLAQTQEKVAAEKARAAAELGEKVRTLDKLKMAQDQIEKRNVEVRTKTEPVIIQKKTMDLEQRLDRMLKEIEELKRELHRPTSATPATEYYYRVAPTTAYPGTAAAPVPTIAIVPPAVATPATAVPASPAVPAAKSATTPVAPKAR